MRNFLVLTPYNVRVRKSGITAYGRSSDPYYDEVTYVRTDDGSEYSTNITVEKLDELLNSD